MDLLVVESVDDEPVVKSKANQVVGVLAGNGADPRRMTRLYNAKSPNNSKGNELTVKSQRALASENANMIFPIKLRDQGLNRKTYYIYTNTEEERSNWVTKILSAKREYSSSVYALNAEPFRLCVVEDRYFGYDSAEAPKLPVFAQATPLDRAIQEYEQKVDSKSLRPCVNSKVNCSISFTFGGMQLTMIGCHNGLYVREEGKKDWTRCLDLTKITQIDVVVDYDLLLILSDKLLVYYNLDQVLSVGISQVPGTIRKTGRETSLTGYAISRSRDVSFFSFGYMHTGPSEKRHLLFYKTKDPDQPLKKTSIIEVMEPIKERGLQNKRSHVISKSISQASTEYFNSIDTVNISSESTGITLFSSTFCVHTSKGFELMLLNYKNPKLIPDFSSISTAIQRSAALKNIGFHGTTPAATTEAIKRKLDNAKPIGSFMISDNQILLCYDSFAIFCDKFACMSSPLVVNFLCKIKRAVVVYPYLVTVTDDLVEVRKLDGECRLKQVITGKDINLINDRDRQITLSMAHPKVYGKQLVVELINNEFVVEDDNSSLAGL